jgi:hypothetical protein
MPFAEMRMSFSSSALQRVTRAVLVSNETGDNCAR